MYPANEKPIPHISATLIYQKIKEHKGEHVYYLPGRKETVPFLTDLITKGDIVITMGAGDVWKIGQELVKKFKIIERKIQMEY
ncbi:MAG: UDP-N-acetylmuramate--L-alanine ligase [Atribacteria bacterium 34_868]|nr:MAG: UDP-N-acetylmuramate--L-alanine ligase [Atribacteria bacterium 34_868]